MLTDRDLFAFTEKKLRDNGTLDRFEAEHGPVLGRSMITLTQLPEGYSVSGLEQKHLFAFECSFDFCDFTLGVVYDTRAHKVVGSVWITRQGASDELPPEECIQFFLRTLIQSVGEDGSFSVPIYTFANATKEMTVMAAPRS